MTVESPSHVEHTFFFILQAQQQKTFNAALQKQNNINYGKNPYVSNDGISEANNDMVLKQNFEEEEHEDEVFPSQIIILLCEVVHLAKVFRTQS